MSRSKKGSKPPGFDCWGKRGQFDKDVTKGSERTVRRDEIQKIKKKVVKRERQED